MPKPEQGRIVRVPTCDPQGRNAKNRPVVIVHPTDEITKDGMITCVAITGEIPKKLPDDCVLLPYQSGGHPRTGLNKRCAAMCSWLIKIKENDIVEYMGFTPKVQLNAILTRIGEIE